MPFADIEIHGFRGRLEWDNGHIDGDVGLLFAIQHYMQGRGTVAELTPEGPAFDRETWRGSAEGFHAAVVAGVHRFQGKVHDSDIGDCIPEDINAETFKVPIEEPT